jgi:bacillopeptidase F (M6 metalloprotease family)
VNWVRKWMKVIKISLFIIGITACSNNEDSNIKKPENINSQSEAVKMIANDEKIIEMLKKSGEIPENASQEEISGALQKYLKDRAPGSLKDEKAKQNYINELKKKIQNNNKN